MAALAALAALAANVSLFLGTNNVHGEVGRPGVLLLGRVGQLGECAELAVANASIRTFTWHHPSFPKPQYAGRCYGHTDGAWAPVREQLIDSGCVTARESQCTAPPVGWRCATHMDCAGGNGACRGGVCACRPGWRGQRCSTVAEAAGTARPAYASGLWSWGGVPVRDPDTALYHLFTSEFSSGCGVLHYCISSFVQHRVSRRPEGPFAAAGVALAPRADAWDNGAVHGVTAHRLPNGSWALFYMGSQQPRGVQHPNCTAGSGDAAANRTFGSHAGRRIGLAVAESLDGPWRRMPAPIFGPDPTAWDHSDVSNPAPIITSSGRVIMLYKGNGRGQHMGIAYAQSVDGPYVRNDSGATPANLPGEDPFGWIDPDSHIIHALFHTGNGAASAGSHRWSKDGVLWYGDGSPAAYTGKMSWASNASAPFAGRQSVLARRERPQLLLDGAPGSSYGRPTHLFTSAQSCNARVDAGTGVPCEPPTPGTDKSFTAVVAVARG